VVERELNKTMKVAPAPSVGTKQGLIVLPILLYIDA
jgi:hypothetical protein